MSHSGDPNLTDCLPSIDQLNNAVRNIVRPVPSATNEAKVQKKTDKKKTGLKSFKEPPKYSDVVLPMSNPRQMTDSQAAHAMTIEGSFTPIQPKPSVSEVPTSFNVQVPQYSSSSCSNEGLTIQTITLPSPSTAHTSSDSSDTQTRHFHAQIVHSTSSPLVLDRTDASPGTATASTVLSQNNLAASTSSSVPLSPGLSHQNLTHTMHGVQLSCGDVPLYPHPGDGKGEVHGDLGSRGDLQAEREHETYRAGQTMCVSPPTVPPSVLEALNIKDGTQLFPALQHNSGIHILSIDNILGHNQANPPYRASPVPNIPQSTQEYSEQSTGIVYQHHQQDTEATFESPQSQVTRNETIKDNETMNEAEDVNHTTVHANDETYNPRNRSDLEQHPVANVGTVIEEKESDAMTEDAVIELLLLKDPSDEMPDHDTSTTPAQQQSRDHSPITDGTYCLECNHMYPDEKPCSLHEQDYLVIPDTPLPTRAVATLPRQLKCLPSENEIVEQKIVANEVIPKGTLFGPLEGVLKASSNIGDANYHVKRYTWPIFENGKMTYLVDCHDQEASNWLMFIRPAVYNYEKNVIMYQNGLKFYYIVSRDIDCGEELAFWFSADYAKLLDCANMPEGMFSCNICKKSFQNSTMLQRHITRQHPDNTNKKFVCNQCNKAFSTSTKLSIHQRGHRGDRPFTCQQCNKGFTDRSNLNKHLKIHSDERPHSCLACGKTFRQKAHLESHVVTHTGYKPFQCSYCEKVYSRQSDLNIHLRSHTKTKQYLCQHCPKTFHKLQNFQKHQLTHTGERNHACKTCGRSFAQKYHLKRHQETCKGTKPKKRELNPQIGAELGLSIAKKRIQKRDRAEQAAKTQNI